MPDQSEDQEKQDQPQESLVDRLGVKGLKQKRLALDGRLFDAAGRQSPVAEFADGALVLHPADKPLGDEGPEEKITVRVSEQGVLLDDNGALKKIPAAKYKGQPLFWLAEQKPGTLKNLASFLGNDGNFHKLYLNGETLTCDVAIRLRNRTVDGDIASFPDLSESP